MENDVCHSRLTTQLKHLQPPSPEPKSSHGLGRGLCAGCSWLEVGGGHAASLDVQKEGWWSWLEFVHVTPRLWDTQSAKEGQWEWLSRAQMLTFMFPSCGKWKDPSDFLGLGAEPSAGKSKSQD